MTHHRIREYARMARNISSTRLWLTGVAGVALLLLSLFFSGTPARASIAYGSINNFDCVNDTGFEAHGFDIELDDIHSKDITYTYDWNHYGVPKISETTNGGKTTVVIRYAGMKKPDGTWTAYTAIPAGPIPPTQGHQFTDPSVNFGGEHFGCGYTMNPTAIRYYWLIDDGAGTLVHGQPVQVSTPVFNYNPPVPAVAPAAVVAVIKPPPPEVPPAKQFGDAVWVKSIKTTTHNANKVHLNDLVGDDEGKPQPWANGEPDEVETEWRILQTGGANDELVGAAEEMPGGDEVVTRRYEFYQYIGPFDAESNEAMATAVGAKVAGSEHFYGLETVTYNDHIDPDTGEWVTVDVDLRTVEVVGDFIGAQMSAVDVNPVMGLIDNLQDGDVDTAYPDRTVVVPGPNPFTATVVTGALPDGLALGRLTGVLTGTPTKAGTYTFTVEADDGGAPLQKAYTINIAGGAGPVTFTIVTSASPAAGGSTTGDNVYNSGDIVAVTAAANPGYTFVNWTEGGIEASLLANYSFLAAADRTLVANFAETLSSVSSLTATPSSGAVLGSLPPGGITLTATVAGTGVGVKYFFRARLRDVDEAGKISWKPVAISGAWSDLNSCFWQPTEPGIYEVQATALDPATKKKCSKFLYYTVRAASLTGIASLTLSPPTGIVVDAFSPGGVTLTAVPTGDGVGATYFFSAKLQVLAGDGSVSWAPVTISTAWGGNTASWLPTEPGRYLVTVLARDASCNTTLIKVVSYLVRPISLRGVSLTASPPSGTAQDAVPAGGIVLTATPDGSGAGSEFFFTARLKDVKADGSWSYVPVTLSTGWGGGTFAWTPSAPGLYLLTVTARETIYGSACRTTIAYRVPAASVKAITAFTPNVPGYSLLSALPVTGVTFTASIEGNGTGVLYRYLVTRYNGSTFSEEPLTDYTSANTFLFKPATAGTYRIWCFAYDATYNTSVYKYTGFVVR